MTNSPSHISQTNSPIHAPHVLRKTLRRQRLALSRPARQRAAQHASRQLVKLPIRLPKHANIAVFVDAFGEMPTQPLIDWAYRQGFAVYLPVVVHGAKPLRFVKLTTKHVHHARLTRHRFGMRQPATGQRLFVRDMDMVVLPLVAFDSQGYRMGMGGGFYDRTLARTKTKPIKVGWAYDFQQVANLEPKPWDVRLDMVITPSGLKRFRRYLAKDFGKDFSNDNEQNAQSDHFDRLTDPQIATVMQPERFHQLLADVDAFLTVNVDDGFF